MTKQEAIQAMEHGHKVKHKLFMPHEYIYLKDGSIHDEDDMPLYGFWQYRISNCWNKDWYIA